MYFFPTLAWSPGSSAGFYGFQTEKSGNGEADLFNAKRIGQTEGNTEKTFIGQTAGGTSKCLVGR